MNWLSSLLLGESASVAWAMIGGLAVAAGLVIEKFAEILDGRFFGGYKAHKNLESAGWLILMFGIFIEVADAGWTAHEISKTEKLAVKNDPINLPIAFVSAKVFLLTEGTNRFDAERLNVPDLVTLKYGRPDQVRLVMPRLFCSDFRYLLALNGEATFWYLQFTQKIEAMAFPPNSLVRDANEWNVFELDAKFLPSGMKILGGTITLTINDTVRTINIPPQKAKEQTDSNFLFLIPPPSVSVFGW